MWFLYDVTMLKIEEFYDLRAGIHFQHPQVLHIYTGLANEGLTVSSYYRDYTINPKPLINQNKKNSQFKHILFQ